MEPEPTWEWVGLIAVMSGEAKENGRGNIWMELVSCH